MIDVPNLLVEFGVGAFLALLSKCLVWGGAPLLHSMSLLFSEWTDANAHSMNSCTQCIGNPLLDGISKLNIVHNLHHAWGTDPRHMTVFPCHHVGGLHRQADIDKCNKLMQTNIQFRP